MAKTVQSRLAKIEQDLLTNKPLPDCLRQCVSLGGDLRSVRLRDWAMKELMGYRRTDEIPSYRTVTPMLQGDGQTFSHKFSGMAIPWTTLPQLIRDDVKDSLDLPDGVAMLEENARAGDRRADGVVKMALPMSADIGRLMSNGDIYFERIYWAVATSVFRGVLDEIRTTAVSVLAEVRSGAPVADVPPETVSEVADQAVNVIVYGGRRHTVNVTTNQVQRGNAISTIPGDGGEALRWTKRQTYWTIVGVGLAVVSVGVTLYLT